MPPCTMLADALAAAFLALEGLPAMLAEALAAAELAQAADSVVLLAVRGTAALFALGPLALVDAQRGAAAAQRTQVAPLAVLAEALAATITAKLRTQLSSARRVRSGDIR